MPKMEASPIHTIEVKGNFADILNIKNRINRSRQERRKANLITEWKKKLIV